jgi:beta-glucosidase
VSFPLDDRSFSYWDPSATANGWRVAPGCYGIFVGFSSRDLPLHGSIARGVSGCS